MPTERRDRNQSTQPSAQAIRWGFLGAGKMATALVRGMLAAGAATADRILASDPFEPARAAFERETGIQAAAANVGATDRSDVLVLAVKPQQMAALLGEIRGSVTARHLVVSIAAGVPLSIIEDELGTAPRLMRVMPNTPALLGEGASAYCRGRTATDDDEAIVQSLLRGVGRAYSVPESLLDAVTGLSGSGPAFVYVIIEALSDGGVRMGLPRDVATGLAAQTVLGAAKMVLETGQHTGILKDQVASPGGTTIAGLQALERGGVRAALIDAVEAATKRAAELGAITASSGSRAR